MTKNFIENRKARFNYELGENFEAGIVLSGAEVKSIKSGQGSLDGAHAVIRGGEAFLVNADIPPYQSTNIPQGHERTRTRKLLLSKKEIKTLADSGEKTGLTIVPISMYNIGRNIKVSLSIARGKKKADKRESIKKRESDKEIMRTLKEKR